MGRDVLPFRWSRGSVIEDGAYATFGLEELVFDADRLQIRTKLGGVYEFERSAVAGVRFGRKRWALGRWLVVVDERGDDAPIAVTVFDSGRLIDALESTGWLLSDES